MSKLIQLEPAFGLGEYDLVAAVQSYTRYAGADGSLELSARQTRLTADRAATYDIASPISLWTPDNSESRDPAINLREQQSAGNLPNPTGIDNMDMSRFQ
jgi:hypothetical protein